MRRLIHVPMLHTPEILEKQRDQMGNTMTDITVPRSQPAAAGFWQIVEDGLGRFKDISQVRFYTEGNDQWREFKKGEINPDFEAAKETLPPEERIITEFMLRVGGTLEPVEDQALIAAQMEVSKELDAVMISADEEDAKFENNDVSREKVVMTAADLLRRVFVIGKRFEELSYKRNGYIAKMINESLKDGETGFLFLGGSHDLSELLEGYDIKFELLDERLPEIIREATKARYDDEDDEDEPLEQMGGGEVKS